MSEALENGRDALPTADAPTARGQIAKWHLFGSAQGTLDLASLAQSKMAETALKLGALALLEDGSGKKVSLDEVIQTMLQTGRDMKNIYKETSLGGLAASMKHKMIPVSVSVIEC